MSLLDRLDHLDEQVGLNPRPPCPTCLAELRSMPVLEHVPLSVRMRFAAGLRVPREYAPWALQEIRREGWPSRQIFTKLPFMMAIAAVIYALYALITGMLPPLWLFALQHVVWIVFGSWMAAFNPGRYRAHASTFYLGQRRRGCRIHGNLPVH